MSETRPAQIATPWAWLRGFAWFLLSWPLLSLMALDEWADQDWTTVVIAVLGPALVGLALLAAEWGMTRALGRRVAALPRHRPSVYRDLSNTALMLLTLTFIVLALGAMDEEAFDDPRVLQEAARLLGVMAAVAFAFRAVHRWRRGPAAVADLGPKWEERPQLTHWAGYLSLLPTLIAVLVMIADRFSVAAGGEAEFGPVAWVVLPALVLLGQRSAMASAPRYWARTPWEAMARAQSLVAPWAALAVALSVAFTVLMVVLPFNPDGTMSETGRIWAGALLVPLGLFTSWLTLRFLRELFGPWYRKFRVNLALAAKPQSLADWELIPPITPQDPNVHGQVRITTRGGLRARYPVWKESDGERLLAWLKRHAQGAGRR